MRSGSARGGIWFIPAVVVAVVAIVTTVVAADPLGVTLVGANVHIASDGNPEQATNRLFLNAFLLDTGNGLKRRTAK